MKVRELIEFLQESNPEALVVANLAFSGGLTQITSVERKTESSLDFLHSAQTLPVVELSNGSADYMRSQGRDVVGVPQIFSLEEFKRGKGAEKS